MKKKNWTESMFAWLSNQSGANDDPDDEDGGDEGDEGEEDGDEDEGSEEEEDEGEEADEEGDGDEETEDGDDDSGNNGGKKRSNVIPRKRFDQVNAKAKRIDRLIELGILTEGEDGELHVAKKPAAKEENEEGEGGNKGKAGDFYFTQDEVDEGSWPLVQKINKGFKHYEALANRMTYTVIQLQSENAILRDYPEFLQKGSPLRKRAMEIMKNDPEFKKTYRGNPEAGYWAVKRAAELLNGKSSAPPKKKNKSKFIVGKGDGGKGGGNKPVDFSTMTKDELDALELKEHQGLFNKGKKK